MRQPLLNKQTNKHEKRSLVYKPKGDQRKVFNRNNVSEFFQATLSHFSEEEQIYFDFQDIPI